MVDLHHHLLPGLDDGSPDLPMSIAMAQAAVADGITHVVCTPHASDRYPFDTEVVRASRARLVTALAHEGVPLQVGTGCDFHLSYDNLRDAQRHPRRYTINGAEYLLIELPDYSLSPHLTQTFYELRMAGMTPILTHPERNLTLQKEPWRLGEWTAAGLLIQVTAGSVTGRMGKPAKKIAHDLLSRGHVHFLATDAHNLTSRPPHMREAYDLVARKFTRAYAEQLCVTNPLAVFNGWSLPAQDAVPYPAAEDGAPWWRRLIRAR